MQVGTVRCLALAMGLRAVAGCGRRVPARQPVVFYDETGDPPGKTAALSERELRAITAWVATQTRDPVWLIRVRPLASGEEEAPAIAHIVPDEMTPRIRIGRAYGVPRSKKRTGIHSPAKYIQISMPDHTFTEQFLKPSPAELPFDGPRIYDPNRARDFPMSKEEVLAIADFVHQPSSYKEVPARPEKSRDDMVREILQSPIFQIERRGNQSDVQLGFMHGLMWGYGLMVKLECTPTGYKITSCSEWMS